MGKQYNKTVKRRRRQDYLERLKTKAKEAVSSKPKARRTTPVRKAATPAAAAPAGAPPAEQIAAVLPEAAVAE